MVMASDAPRGKGESQKFSMIIPSTPPLASASASNSAASMTSCMLPFHPGEPGRAFRWTMPTTDGNLVNDDSAFMRLSWQSRGYARTTLPASRVRIASMIMAL